MNRRTFLNRCILAAGVATTAHASGQKAPTDNDNFIREVMQREGVPGLQIAEIRNGEITHVESFGVTKLETESPVTGDTLFEAASLTKPVFAYVVMKLIEEGVLALDTRLEGILEPPASGPPERTRELTPELILSHRTGLPNWWRRDGKPSLRPSQGRLFAYSGMAYVYLQQGIEKLTGKPLEILLRERLFDPLGMHDSFLTWQDEFTSRLAHGHSPKGAPIRYMMEEAISASSLVCTAQDYAKFAAIIAKPPTPSEVFLKPESLKKIFTPYVEAGPEIQWGLGWGLQMPADQPTTYFHWGNNGNAYHSFVVVNPETGDGAVIMTNSGNGLRSCADIVPKTVPGDHPALRWNRVVQQL